MYEYDVPARYHIDIPRDPSRLFTLAIGLLGDLAAHINSDQTDSTLLKELRDSLRFSAYFFDAYRESKLNQTIDPYLLFLGSASYYLCDLPGSSNVLARQLGTACPDLGCLGLEKLMLWLLAGDFSGPIKDANGIYGEHIKTISHNMVHFYQNGLGGNDLLGRTKQLRKFVYDNGTPRQLLFADVICSLIRKRYQNSTWFCLPNYSGLPLAVWHQILQKKSFIRELWPAQHLLGEKGVYRGASAVVQMPTSAGKTRATEIIIRSAFLSGRTSLAVIVAPFRALCHEIKNSLESEFYGEDVNVDEFTDVLQADSESVNDFETPRVRI